MNTLIGVDLLTESSTPLFPVGQVYIDEYGRQFLYGKAKGALTAGRWNLQATDGTYDMEPVTTTLVATPGSNWFFGSVACHDMTDDYYGWFWIGFGTFEAIIENNYAAGDVIYTTANAGIPGTNSSSATLDGVKTIDAGATSTRVTVFAAGRITYGLTAVMD